MQFTISLKKNIYFKKLYNTGCFSSNDLLIMCYKKNDLGFNRLGIVVSKKIDNNVGRNKVKRRIKECYRIKERIFKKGYDIVFIVKKRIKYVKFLEIKEFLYDIVKKKNLIINFD